MQDNKTTNPDDEPFDLAQWAERHGIRRDRSQAKEIAGLLGLSPHHVRALIKAGKVTRTIRKFADALDRLADMEAALTAERRARAEAVIDHMTKFGKKTDMSTNELMAMTRDDA